MCFFAIPETAESYVSLTAVPGWLFVIGLVFLAWRNWRSGLLISPGIVRYQAQLRDRTWPTTGIGCFRSRSYSGLLNWYGKSPFLHMLVLEYPDGTTRELRAIVGSPGKMRSAADDANRAVCENGMR